MRNKLEFAGGELVAGAAGGLALLSSGVLLKGLGPRGIEGPSAAAGAAQDEMRITNLSRNTRSRGKNRG